MGQPSNTVTVNWQGPVATGEATLTSNPAAPAANEGITLTATLSVSARRIRYTFEEREDASDIWHVIGARNKVGNTATWPGQPAQASHDFRVTISYDGQTAHALLTVLWGLPPVIRGQNIVRIRLTERSSGFGYNSRGVWTRVNPNDLDRRVSYDWQPSSPGRKNAVEAGASFGSDDYPGTEPYRHHPREFTLIISRIEPSSPGLGIRHRTTDDSNFRLRMALDVPTKPADHSPTVWKFRARAYSGVHSEADGVSRYSPVATLTWYSETFEWLGTQADVVARGGDPVTVDLIGARGGAPPYTYRLERSIDLPNMTHSLTEGDAAVSGSAMGRISGTADPAHIGGYPYFKVCRDQRGVEIRQDFVINQILPNPPSVVLSVDNAAPARGQAVVFTAAVTNDLRDFYRMRTQHLDRDGVTWHTAGPGSRTRSFSHTGVPGGTSTWRVQIVLEGTDYVVAQSAAVSATWGN